MRTIVLLLLVGCGAPECRCVSAPEAREWWPLPGRVALIEGALDAPSRAYLEEIVRITQNRADVRRVRVQGPTEEDARAVADVLAGMGMPRATIEIGAGTDRVELSLLLARDG